MNQKPKQHAKQATLLRVLLILYTLWLVYMMFFGVSRSGGGIYRYNLIPFATISNYIVYFDRYNFDTWVMNLFGNIGVFAPFGVILPLLFPKLRKPMRLLVVFFIGIVALEIFQMLFHRGSFDVDDILLNSLGALIGLWLLNMAKRKFD